MILTREEKERLVLDLYNQGKSTREIAQIAHMSFRDIGFIIDKKEKEQESKEGQTRQGFLSTQAYDLFSEGKTPEEVAIALNLTQPQVTEFYTEHWKLKGLYMLNQIYEEIQGDIGSFVNLYQLAKAAGMGVPHVVKILEIANNHLPAVELRFERSKKEAATLEFEKTNSTRESSQLINQIIMIRKTLDSTHLDCEKEMERLRHLQQKRIKQEDLVKHFENNNEVYIKIRKTVEEEVHSVLSDKKMLLKLALLSLTESMRKDPDKYSSLMYNSMSSIPKTQSIGYSSNQHYGPASSGLQRYSSLDYISMLLEESEKLYTSLIKEWVDKIITYYTSSITSSSLPVLSQSDEKNESHPRQTTEALQGYMHTEEHRFVQSEIDKENQDE
jgi:hypothetical protein